MIIRDFIAVEGLSKIIHRIINGNIVKIGDPIDFEGFCLMFTRILT